MLGGLAFLLMGTALPHEAEPPVSEPWQLAATRKPATDELDGFQTLSDSELADYRGGFTWQGVDITLGAQVRTYLNGELVLQTNISWTQAGVEKTQLVSGALTPADAAQLQAGILAGGQVSVNVAGQDVFLANGGQTLLMHRADGSIQNILLNTASNIEARQEIDAVVDLQNFSQFQQQLFESRLGHSIGEALGQATIGSLGN